MLLADVYLVQTRAVKGDSGAASQIPEHIPL
jgi:hypothetical protein